MAVALTSFVQPMLIGNQSSTSSLRISTEEHEADGLIPKDACPSPSPSGSCISRSPSTSRSSNQSLIHHKDSSPYSNIIDIDHDLSSHGKTMTIHDEFDQELSISTSLSLSQCRYCYTDILRKSSVSQCHCSGVLCKECLVNELKLTHSRAGNVLQCTVCKNEYDVQTEFSFNMNEHCHSLCMNTLIHCGLKDEQYLLDSVGGKLGFFLVILGINTWVLSTSLLFAFPPNGCPIELYYMVSVFDFAVGVSTIWFIIKCRYVSPLCLSIMYLMRCVYIVMGWIPQINLCNIYHYHSVESNHTVVLSYFVSFSLVASIIMSICWIIDFREQYQKYSKEHGKLVLNTKHMKIEIKDIVNREVDAFV
eukprot:123844_1